MITRLKKYAVIVVSAIFIWSCSNEEQNAGLKVEANQNTQKGSLMGGKYDNSEYAKFTSNDEDPRIWLEEVEGEKALDWVRFQNERTLTALEADDRYEIFKNDVLKIVHSEEKIAFPAVRGAYVYNFWQDAANIRGVWPIRFDRQDKEPIFGVMQADTFFTYSYFWSDDKGNLRKMPLPERVSTVGFLNDHFIFRTRQDWMIHVERDDGKPDDQEFTSGTLLALDWVSLNDSDDESLEKTLFVEPIFIPTDRQSIEDAHIMKSKMLVSMTDNIKGQLKAVEPVETGWSVVDVRLPAQGSLNLVSSSKSDDIAYFTLEDYLLPDTLMEFDGNRTDDPLTQIDSLPSWFDASEMKAVQYEVRSTDGTLVPYTVIVKADLPLNGKIPTILYGYGGFEISELPSYSGSRGKLWLERGGAWVVANIRGGGEFGPNWHQAGLKTERQIIYDDFIAVAEDLVERGVTSPAHLGIIGRSNGGLLMGVMIVQRPDLFNAAVVGVPLLDMLRYHELLAGASWVGEYGDPEIPEERAFLEKISPYHNIDPDKNYPVMFFVTSTKDDRVHPAHARKMAHLLDSYSRPFYYYENIDGGHASSANLQETAHRLALEFVYFSQLLMDEE